jgi:hypothetical protein
MAGTGADDRRSREVTLKQDTRRLRVYIYRRIIMMKTTLVSAAAIALLASAGTAIAQNNTKPAPRAATITVFDIGTGAPPASLSGIAMEKAPAGHACTGESPGPTSTSFGLVTPSPADTQRCVGVTWGTWSHGYVGDVWYTGGATSQSISLPAGVSAAYAYVEPNPFAVQTCEMTAIGSSGSQSTGPFPVSGDSGARGWGFVEGAGTISQIMVSCDVDFATGTYGVGGSGSPCDLDGDGDYDRDDLIFQLRGCLRAGTGGCIAQLLQTIRACGRPGGN